ncbi:hypothetical protein K505DRAFT_194518, partial [Melanomma pulvis-pyrius CBS 109.77]
PIPNPSHPSTDSVTPITNPQTSPDPPPQSERRSPLSQSKKEGPGQHPPPLPNQSTPPDHT